MNINDLWENVLNNWAWQIKEEFVELLQRLAAKAPKVVVEVGVHKGGTSAAWLSIGATVFAIDIKKQPNISLLEALCGHRFTFHTGTSTTFMEAVQSGQIETGRVDMVFIDGDHSYEAAKLDYETLRPLVAPGGIIVFHDIADTALHAKQGCEVARLWKEIKTEQDFEILSGDVWGGIGVKFV